MPPIPIHKNDPIHPTAQKPSGTTPQTADPPPTHTIPASTTTTTASRASPPMPQPGARPIAPTTSSSMPAPPLAPEPPQPGYTATHITTSTFQTGPPPQLTIPPPSDAQLATRSTTTATTATTASKPGPTTLNLGPAQSLYQTEHTREAVEARPSGEERRSLEHPPGYHQNPDNSPYGTGLGGAQQDGGSSGGVGEAAWNMLSKAGEALKKGEEAAWRAVRKQ
ncbi:hypothetical protein CC78DRAFT_333350 [Lojkania enalia]|uniref:Uncharacterized protein n=1 Tax=Lojkania enalia TaxID=147567 RepID=A0A9P4KIW0_9PLEO|nr:hypothetical protein CC78DRAFT_333350 [Didymosphaeria enalia]